MSFIPMGQHLETVLGSLLFLFMVALFSVLIGSLYLACCCVMMLLRGDIWSTYCSVGFSGVLFALLVVQLEMTGAQPQSLFGMVTVPPRIFPFALAIVLQAVMPQVSALGHG